MPAQRCVQCSISLVGSFSWARVGDVGSGVVLVKSLVKLWAEWVGVQAQPVV
jgi:hypothetical protein